MANPKTMTIFRIKPRIDITRLPAAALRPDVAIAPAASMVDNALRMVVIPAATSSLTRRFTNVAARVVAANAFAASAAFNAFWASFTSFAVLAVFNACLAVSTF